MNYDAYNQAGRDFNSLSDDHDVSKAYREIVEAIKTGEVDGDFYMTIAHFGRLCLIAGRELANQTQSVSPTVGEQDEQLYNMLRSKASTAKESQEL